MLEFVAGVGGVTVVGFGDCDVAANSWQAKVQRKPVPPELEKGFHHVRVYEEKVSIASLVRVILRGLRRGLQNLDFLRKEESLINVIIIRVSRWFKSNFNLPSPNLTKFLPLFLHFT